MAPGIDAAADALRAATTARDAFARAGSALAAAGHDLQPGAAADAIAADIATASAATRQLNDAPVGTVPDATRTLLAGAGNQADRWHQLVRWQQPAQWADLLHSLDTPTSALESAAMLLDPAAAARAGAGDATRGAAVLHARAAADHIDRALASLGDSTPAGTMRSQADLMTARTLARQLDGDAAAAWAESARKLWATRGMRALPADADAAAAAARVDQLATHTDGARAAAASLRAAAADGATSTLRLAPGAASFQTASLVRSNADVHEVLTAAANRGAQARFLDEAGQLAAARDLATDGVDLARLAGRVHTAADARQLPLGAASAGTIEEAARVHFAALLDLPVVRDRLPEQLGMDIEALEHAARTTSLAQALHVESSMQYQRWGPRMDAVTTALADARPADPTPATHPLTTAAARMRATADRLVAPGSGMDVDGWRADPAGTLAALRTELAGWRGFADDARTVFDTVRSSAGHDGRGPARAIATEVRGAFTVLGGRMRDLAASDLGRSLPEEVGQEFFGVTTVPDIDPTYLVSSIDHLRGLLEAMPTIVEPTAQTHPTLFALRRLQHLADAVPASDASGIATELATSTAEGRRILTAPLSNTSRAPGVPLVRSVLDSRQSALATTIGAREGELPIEVLDAWARVDSGIERYRSFPEPGRLDALGAVATDLATALDAPAGASAVDAATTTRLKAASQRLRDLAADAGDAGRSAHARLEAVVDLAESVHGLTNPDDPGVAWRTARVRHVVSDLAGQLRDLRTDSTLPFDGATRRTLRGAQNELEYARDARFADDSRVLLDDARDAVAPVLSLRAPGGILAPGTTLRMLPPGDMTFVRERLAGALASFEQARPVEDDYHKLASALPIWKAALADAEDALVASSGALLPDDITSRMLGRVDELSRQVEAASLQFERTGKVAESRQPKRALLGFVRKDLELLRDLSDPAAGLAPDAI